MKKAGIRLFGLFLLFVLTVNSCTNIFDQKDYILVVIENRTAEPLVVYGGLSVLVFSIPSAVIPAGERQAVAAGKGKTVSVDGNKTNKKYGSKTFYSDSSWVIH